MVFYDPPTGPNASQLLNGYLPFAGNPADFALRPLPVVFDVVSLVNRTQTDGVEVLYTYRDHPTHSGGEIVWMAGGRYVSFYDDFNALGLGGNLGQSAGTRWPATTYGGRKSASAGARNSAASAYPAKAASWPASTTRTFVRTEN